MQETILTNVYAYSVIRDAYINVCARGLCKNQP